MVNSLELDECKIYKITCLFNSCCRHGWDRYFYKSQICITGLLLIYSYPKSNYYAEYRDNVFSFCISLFANTLFAQIDYRNVDKRLLDSLLSNTLNLKAVWLNTDTHRLQIIYTRVLHESKNKIQLENHTYNLSDELYFYPASLVKLPVCVFTLEKLNKLKSHDISLDSKISIEDNHSCQTAVTIDKLSDNFTPTLGNYIQKALVISNNESYNRLYEFVGQEYINNRLSVLGYKNHE